MSVSETGIESTTPYSASRSKQDRIRLALVEENPLICAGLRSIVQSDEGIEVIGDHGSLQQATARQNIDVDVLLVGGEAFDDTFRKVLRQFHCSRSNAEVGLVAVMQPENVSMLRNAVMCSTRGFVDRATSQEDLGRAVREVYRGRMYLSSSIAETLVGWVAKGVHSERLSASQIEAVLTERELQILEALGGGMSNTLIARRLSIQEATVRSHTYNILNKLNLRTRTEAVLVGHGYAKFAS